MALVGVLSTHGTLKPTSIPQNRMSCAGTSSFSSSSMAEKPPSPAEQSTVDNIISGILKAVNEEEPYVCSSCRSGTSSAVSVWNGHSISSNSRCSSMASYSPQSLSPTPSFCDRHHEPLRFICETCMLPLCSECVTPDHRCHQIVSMQDATDKARTIAVQMQTEVMVLKTSVREAADTAQRMSESLEVRSHQARLSVQTTIRRAIQALQERECELISMINNISQSKSRILVTQMENFNTTLLGLSRLMDCLSESIDKGNSLEVISTARNAQSEVTRLRFTCTDLNPHEDDRITFVAPDASFLRALSSLGSINTTNGRYVSARSLRENSSQIRPFVPRIALNRELECEPQGRPIFGMISAVICKEPLSVIPYLIFGSEGSEDGKLCRPWGVCCHRSGKLIVADRSNNRIQVFNGDGTYSHKFGSKGSECGQFEKPAGVAVDPQDRIVVADKDNHRIQVFQMDGTFLLTFGQKGQRHGQFSYPWDVACNSLSQIVVSDTRNHRVQLFTPDGAFINKYGFDGNGMLWKQFDSPRGVCFTPTGHIVVTDFNNHRIVVIDPAMNNAQYLGTEGSNQMQFMRPQGVVCDDEGRIIVADSRNNRIQVLNSSGTHLWQIGRSGKGPGEFDRPSGICLNPEGRIVVVDFANERVQIF